MFAAFIDELRLKLRQSLPGKDVQYLMAPLERRMMKEFIPQGKVPRLGSVLALFYPVGDTPYIVLMKRPEYDGIHAGQISLPGGKFEEGDPDLASTAVRETQEETGAEMKGVELLGKLTDIYIPPSNFHVHPFVACLPSRPAFHPDPQEVASLLEVSADELRRATVKNMKRFNRTLQKEVETPYYDIQGEVVWGATAMILSELREMIGK